jgi:DNA polymerase-3 subunit epsilon
VGYKLVAPEKIERKCDLDRPISEVRFVAVDIETTGSQPPKDRIIEIGAVEVQGYSLGGTFREFVNPHRKLPPFISRLTGISNSTLDGQREAEEVLPEFLDFLGDAVLVAHFAAFDFKFLSIEALRAAGRRLENHVLCTCRLARRIHWFLPSKGLDAITHYLDIPVNGRHRALGDAEATARILVRFQEYMQSKQFRESFGYSNGILTLRDLLTFQDSRIPESGIPGFERRNGDEH